MSRANERKEYEMFYVLTETADNLLNFKDVVMTSVAIPSNFLWKRNSRSSRKRRQFEDARPPSVSRSFCCCNLIVHQSKQAIDNFL